MDIIEQDMSMFINQFDNSSDYKFYKKIRGFKIFIRKSYNNMNFYKIEGNMPCKSKKCISYLSSPEIREDISKKSMTCKVIQKVDKNRWYEIIKINPGDNLFFDNLYSVELITKNKNLLYSYSKDPPNSYFEESLEKRENIFTGIRCDSIDDKSCKLNAILTFGEFEMSQKTIVESMVEHFELFREALAI